MDWGIVGYHMYKQIQLETNNLTIGTRPPSSALLGESQGLHLDNLHSSTKRSMDKSDLSPCLLHMSPHRIDLFKLFRGVYPLVLDHFSEDFLFVFPKVIFLRGMG